MAQIGVLHSGNLHKVLLVVDWFITSGHSAALQFFTPIHIVIFSRFLYEGCCTAKELGLLILHLGLHRMSHD